MFRLEVFVAKKHLADVFERLTNIADIHSVALVPNLEAKANGKIYQTSADTIELLSKEIHKRGKSEIMGPEIKVLVAKAGFSPTSYHHYVGSLIQAGVLKKGKKIQNAMQYIVTGK